MPPKIVVLGVGIVGSCFLEMLMKTKPGQKLASRYGGQVLVVDKLDKSTDPAVVEATQNSKLQVKLWQLEVTAANIESEFLKCVKKGDVLVDLSWNIYFQPLIQHCLRVGADYINTSIETYELEGEEHLEVEFVHRALHERHREVRLLQPRQPKSRIMIIQGMNPGLISLMAFRALETIAHQVLSEAKRAGVETEVVVALGKHLRMKNWAMVAALLDVKAFHCSENDTQVTNAPRVPGSFKNSWSPYGFYAEGVDPVQLGWGSAEHKMPPEATVSFGTNTQIYLPIRGVDAVAESHTYDRRIVGMLISHSENDTLSEALTVKNANGQVVYRPSAYYVYSPSQEALDSISEVRKNGYRMLPSTTQIRGHDIVSGEDAVGSLLVFDSHPIYRLVYGEARPPAAFWCGSILNIQQTRDLNLTHSGPTAVQVGISLIATLNYLSKQAPAGITFPEELPHNRILEACDPYLGTLFCDWVNYTPSTTQFAGVPAKLERKEQTMAELTRSSTCAIL